MINLYGVNHMQAKDMESLNLDDFTMQLVRVLDVTIPVNAPNKEEAIKKAIIKNAKAAEEARISLSFVQYPDRAGW
jgi:hypothetical protein